MNSNRLQVTGSEPHRHGTILSKYGTGRRPSFSRLTGENRLLSSSPINPVDPKQIQVPPAGRARGFTLLELLVVIGIIAILAGLLVPALVKARNKARAVQCINNYKQLQLAWLMYTDDFDGDLPLSQGRGNNPAWVQGIMDFKGGADNSNKSYLLSGALGRYLNSVSVYKCPSDDSTSLENGGESRVRSASMNLYMGAGYKKANELSQPSSLWVFVDEHSDSIDDAAFEVNLEKGNNQKYQDFPAGYHNRATPVSFVDGHIELHTWVTADTLQPVRHNGNIPKGKSSPNNKDISWLQDRTVASEVDPGSGNSQGTSNDLPPIL